MTTRGVTTARCSATTCTGAPCKSYRHYRGEENWYGGQEQHSRPPAIPCLRVLLPYGDVACDVRVGAKQLPLGVFTTQAAAAAAPLACRLVLALGLVKGIEGEALLGSRRRRYRGGTCASTLCHLEGEGELPALGVPFFLTNFASTAVLEVYRGARTPSLRTLVTPGFSAGGRDRPVRLPGSCALLPGSPHSDLLCAVVSCQN